MLLGLSVTDTRKRFDEMSSDEFQIFVLTPIFVSFTVGAAVGAALTFLTIACKNWPQIEESEEDPYQLNGG